jgi:5,6-dimethylbenzimidazole synthase
MTSPLDHFPPRSNPDTHAAPAGRREFLKTGTIIGAGLAMALPAIARADGETSDCSQAVLDTINKRRSIRAFQSTPIPDEHLQKILHAARMAPTSGNQQPWKFLVVRDPAKIKALETALYDRACLYWSERGLSPKDYEDKQADLRNRYQTTFSAPVYVVILTDNESKWPTYNHWDGPLAAGNLILAATALGYGTVFYTDSIPTEITKQVLAIPDRYTRVCITPIGVPVQWPEKPEKKELAEMVIYDSFS